MSLAEIAEDAERRRLDKLTYEVRGCIYEVFKELGPGLLESVYEAALVYELRNKGLQTESQVAVPVVYKSQKLDLGFRLDVLVERKIIVEIKSVEMLLDIHKKQLLNYLKLMNKKVGLLVNFNIDFLKDKQSLIRIVNNY